MFFVGVPLNFVVKFLESMSKISQEYFSDDSIFKLVAIKIIF